MFLNGNGFAWTLWSQTHEAQGQLGGEPSTFAVRRAADHVCAVIARVPHLLHVRWPLKHA